MPRPRLKNVTEPIPTSTRSIVAYLWPAFVFLVLFLSERLLDVSCSLRREVRLLRVSSSSVAPFVSKEYSLELGVNWLAGRFGHDNTNPCGKICDDKTFSIANFELEIGLDGKGMQSSAFLEIDLEAHEQRSARCRDSDPSYRFPSSLRSPRFRR